LVRAAASPVVAFTFDLHEFDRAEDIARTAEWFRESCGIATFFVPSAMFAEARYGEPLRRVQRLGHEVASHTHAHDWREVDALMEGSREDVAFLSESFDRHGQFFGAAPTSFRSPRWCVLGPAAIEELARLGYAADSSATPQRLPLFSSKPWHPGWWSSPRRPHYLAPGLVEIPTSTLLVPAAAPTFLTLRAAGSRALLALLELEARLDRDHPIVLQFHVEDFLLDGRRERDPGRLSWAHLLPRARGGFALKHFLRDREPARIVRSHLAILERFAGFQCSTITGIARHFMEAEGSRDLSGGKVRAPGHATLADPL